MAQQLITTASIISELRPGLAKVASNMKIYDQWADIFTVYKSDKAEEYETRMQMVGSAQQVPQGTPIPLSSAGQFLKITYKNLDFGIAYEITAQAIADNLYKSEFPRNSKGLMNGLINAKNIQAANVFNFGFSSILSDGQPLYSLSHPIGAAPGSYANMFKIGVSLSQSSLQDAIIKTTNEFYAENGMKMSLTIDNLLVSPGLQFTAEEILGSKYKTDTANNNINAIYSTHAVRKGLIINNQITIPTFWSLITNQENGFKLYQRQAIETDIETKPLTRSLIAMAWERYSVGCSDPTACFGSYGA
jgi:hypothetical protein